MKRYITILLFSFLAVLASCSKINFNELKINKPYVGVYEGENCVVVFEQVDEGTVEGKLYFDDGDLIAENNMFTSDLKKNGKGLLRINGGEKRLEKVSVKSGKLCGAVDGKSFTLSLVPVMDLPFKSQYKTACYEVVEEKGRLYANNVEGYWMAYPDTQEDFATIYINKVSSLASTKKLNLGMDLYYPKDTTSWHRPLLLLIHGGAFYNGDKQAIGYPEMGRYFAERGYVVASINYRLGFKPLAGDVDRAGYRAVQDAHAAVCYLIDNADEFGIDTTMIFAAGTSAGAITALNLAFMIDENRPYTTKAGGVKGWFSEKSKKLIGYVDKGLGWFGDLFNLNWGIDGDKLCEKLGLDSDLGPINAVAGETDRPFKIKAVVNMWGAVHDLAMLGNSPETSILSFHGDADPIVPYGYGYPFDKVLEPYTESIINGLPEFLQGVAVMARKWVTDDKPINEWAFSPMQGSKAIHDKASSTKGRSGRSELHTLMGSDSHSLHADHGGLTNYFYDTIIPVTTRFLYEEIMGCQTVSLVQKDVWFEALDTDNVAELHWQVEGGTVVGRQGDNKIRVLFFSDAREHSVSVCGRYRNGVEFRENIGMR